MRSLSIRQTGLRGVPQNGQFYLTPTVQSFQSKDYTSSGTVQSNTTITIPASCSVALAANISKGNADGVTRTAAWTLAGNAMTALFNTGSASHNTGNIIVSVAYYLSPVAGSSITLTNTWSGTQPGGFQGLWCLTNVNTASLVGGSASQLVGASATNVALSLTPLFSNSLIIAIFGKATADALSTFTPSGWTNHSTGVKGLSGTLSETMRSKISPNTTLFTATGTYAGSASTLLGGLLMEIKPALAT